MISGVRIDITIGGRQVLRCHDLWIESARHMPLTVASITLPDGSGSLYRGIGPGEPVTIRFGLRDQAATVWTGTVAGPCSGGGVDDSRLRVAGNELPLINTYITQHFEHERPEAIVRWAIGRSGMKVGRVDSPGVTFPHFVASHVTVRQLAGQAAGTCQRGFDLDMSRWALWVGSGNVVNWGDFDEPGDPPDIATGKTLITHNRGNGGQHMHMVSALLTAGLRHSHSFHLIDDRIGMDGFFRALRVRHHLHPERARTLIWYGTEYGRR